MKNWLDRQARSWLNRRGIIKDIEGAAFKAGHHAGFSVGFDRGSETITRAVATEMWRDAIGWSMRELAHEWTARLCESIGKAYGHDFATPMDYARSAAATVVEGDMRHIRRFAALPEGASIQVIPDAEVRYYRHVIRTPQMAKEIVIHADDMDDLRNPRRTRPAQPSTQPL